MAVIFLQILSGIVLLPAEDFQEVYDGVWGFNAILASASLMCVFYAFNFYSVLLGTFNLACVICAQYAMRATMSVEVRTFHVKSTFFPSALYLGWKK